MRSPVHAAFLASTVVDSLTRLRRAAARSASRARFSCFQWLTPENIAQHRQEAAKARNCFLLVGSPTSLTPEVFPAARGLLLGRVGQGLPAPGLLEQGRCQSGRGRERRTRSPWPIFASRRSFSVARATSAIRGCAAEQDGDSDRGKCFAGPGTLRGRKIALLRHGRGGAGSSRPGCCGQCDLNVLAMDPYLTPAQASELGVELVTMEEAFAQGYIVSNHLPNLPELKGVLDRRLFASMRGSDAAFLQHGAGCAGKTKRT